MSAEQLFDRYAADYEAALERGLKLSGESVDYFSDGRVRYLVRKLRRLGLHGGVRRVLDFGCGTGATSAKLLAAFPCTEVVGVDSSAKMVERARRERAQGGLRFEIDTDIEDSLRGFDLVYVANVFHHVGLRERPALFRRLEERLREGGLLAFFENNPWNPGARAVMARISLDDDASPLSVLAAKGLLRGAGFSVLHTGSLFYFPRCFSALRVCEGFLGRWPLGAQYAVIAQARKGVA